MSVDNVFSRLELALERIENTFQNPVSPNAMIQQPASQESEKTHELLKKIDSLETKNRDLQDKINYTDKRLANLQTKIEKILEGLP